MLYQRNQAIVHVIPKMIVTILRALQVFMKSATFLLLIFRYDKIKNQFDWTVFQNIKNALNNVKW